MKDQTMTQQNLQLPDGTVRMAPTDEAIIAITAATATQVFTMTNEKVVRYVLGVRIVNSSGVSRTPSGAVLPLPANAATNTTNTVSVTDSAFANGDTLFIRYASYAV